MKLHFLVWNRICPAIESIYKSDQEMCLHAHCALLVLPLYGRIESLKS